MTRTIMFAATLVLTVAAGALHYADASAVVVFLHVGIRARGARLGHRRRHRIGRRALRPCDDRRPAVDARQPARAVHRALRALGRRSRDRAVVLLGSLFANALLVLGLAIVAGCGTERRDDAFNPRLPNDTATLLLLAVFLITMLGISRRGRRPGERAPLRSPRRGGRAADRLRGVALGLPALRRACRAGARAAAAPVLPFRFAVGLLAGAGSAQRWSRTGSSTRSAPRSRRSGSPGVHRARDRRDRGQRGRERRRVQLARKGQNDLAISVVKNSVAQIAVLPLPGARPRHRSSSTIG